MLLNYALWQQLRPLLPDNCSPGDSLQDDLGLDSLTYVELIIQIESLFDIHFSDDEIWEMRTVMDLVLGIERRLSPVALLLMRLGLN